MGKAFIVVSVGSVDLKNKTKQKRPTYFTSKMSLFRNSKKLQFGTNKLW